VKTDLVVKRSSVVNILNEIIWSDEEQKVKAGIYSQMRTGILQVVIQLTSQS
jgi:hypothetical protein